MKQPRTSDFDPNAKSHDLKSSMEDFPSIEKPMSTAAIDKTRPLVPPVLPVRPVRVVPSPATSRRKIKTRHPFDIYEDQVEELRKLALEDRMRGGAGSQSAMVREALDEYIAKVRAE
jgi:hypothetical protein